MNVEFPLPLRGVPPLTRLTLTTINSVNDKKSLLPWIFHVIYTFDHEQLNVPRIAISRMLRQVLFTSNSYEGQHGKQRGGWPAPCPATFVSPVLMLMYTSQVLIQGRVHLEKGQSQFKYSS